MKRFIVTILALTVLVGSVFAKPKKVESTNVDGYELVVWDLGTSQKFATFEEPVQLFLAELLLDTRNSLVGTCKYSITDLTKDLQELIKEYDYYICTLDGKVVSVVYKNDADTVWMLIY